MLIEHTESIVRKTNLAKCEVCGQPTLWRCQKCSKPLFVMDKGAFAGGACLRRYHSDTFFGLAKRDAKMYDIGKWKPSNQNKIKRHAFYMHGLVKAVNETDGLDILDADDSDLGAVDHVGI